MAKKPAPTALTGGAGFSYEDQIGAYFILHMLAGRQPLGPDYGTIHAVHFQARESEWLLDDLLVELQTHDQKHSLAISAKRRRQVTRKRFPADFVQTVWEQWLGRTSACFVKGRDLLGLVTGQLADPVKEAWNDLLRESLLTDPARLVARIHTPGQTSKMERDLFDSLHCPGDLQASTGTDETATGDLIKHIRLFHLDFRACPSTSRVLCLSICQSVLASGDPTEAADLWKTLVTFAWELRLGGSTDISRTIRRLCPQFDLKEHPAYEADWRQLSRISGEAMNVVRRDINGHSLPRAQVAEQIRTKMKEARVLAMLGESGCGKSALAKELLEDEELCPKGIWFSSEMLDKADIVAVEQRLGVRNPLAEVLRSVTSPAAVLVIDGIDRCSPQAISNAATLLSNVGLGEADCQWRVVITCQRETWEMILRQLMSNRIPREWITPLPIKMPTLPDIDSFLSQFPNLRLPAFSTEIRPLLRNLKTLDCVVAAAMSDPDVEAKGWTGVSDVIEWIWQQWISGDGDPYAKAEGLKLLGKLEADTLTSGVPISKLPDAARTILPELKIRGLVRTLEERVYFAHDLIGDWSRLRILIEEQGNISFLRPRVRLPRWRRATRMYAQRMLESTKPGQWRTTVASLNNTSPDDVALQDIFLEAATMAVNSYQLLKQVWPDLSCDKAELLDRLLRRFLHAATMPDPRITALAGSDDDIGYLAAVIRVPYWPYWAPMLSFLNAHRLELPVRIHKSVCRVVGLWLEKTPSKLQDGNPWPLRHEAAAVSLQMAREIQAAIAEGAYFPDDSAQDAYRAFLNAAPDLPEEVTQLALELCRRRDPAPEIVARKEQAIERQRKEREEFLSENPEAMERQAKLARSLPSWGNDWPMRDPWPDGPASRIDDTFQKVVLETSSIGSLIAVRPEVAREVILAACIEEPQEDDPFNYRDMIIDPLGMDSAPDAYPPAFFRGPFLTFLRLKPEAALDAIIRLVNFATDRWLESQQRWANADGQTIEPEFLRIDVPLANTTARWIGDNQVYGWFRNLSISADIVVSALMACEKWLYDLLDANEDPSPWVSRILEESRSVAFLGLLAAVGKKKHDLFDGSLTPLLGSWQIYGWDNQVLLSANFDNDMMPWTSSGEKIWNFVRDWHVMAHRKQSLQELGVFLLLTNENIQRFYDNVRQQWAVQLDADPTNETLEFLLARFDATNYTELKDENGNIGMELVWPEKLRANAETDMHESQVVIDVLAFPLMCRRILDGEQTLTANELPDFWDKLHRLAGLDENQHAELSTHQIAAVVCGGIAVLLTKHKPWVKEQEDRFQWCMDRLSEIAASSPPEDELASSMSIITHSEDSFVTEAAVALLADEPSSKFARQLVASGITGFYYGTTSIAMWAGYRFRRELGDQFDRMQNLAVLWAALRMIGSRGNVLKADMARLPAWHSRLTKSFIEGTLPAERIPWQRIESFARRSLERMEIRYRTRWWEPTQTEAGEESATETAAESNNEEDNSQAISHGRPRRSVHYPGFDIQVLHSAFSWLPNLTEAQDREERRGWIETWRELLTVVLRMVGSDEMDENDELSGTPYAYDRWVFKGVAQLIPQMTPGEEPDRLWRPIVDLGPVAHHWVESFLRDWVIHGPDAAESPAHFVEYWRPMIEYCLRTPRWNRNGRAGLHLDEMHINLMGLGLGSEHVGQEEFAGPIGSMLDLYERWADNCLSRWHVLRYLVVFLTKPAARTLVCPAIQWIRSTVKDYSNYDWRGFNQGELESLITDALRVCWRQHRQSVQDDEILREAFLGLLTILTNRLCPSAMELQDEVIRSLHI